MSKVIRVSEEVFEILSELKPEGSRWSKFMDSLLDEIGSGESWTLPSSLHGSKKKAREQALKIAAQLGHSLEDAEVPRKVRCL